MGRRHPYRSIVEARATRARRRHRQPKAPVGRVGRFLRFAGSSLLCTAIDQLIAGVLFVALRGVMAEAGFLRILVASLDARCVSQALNYMLNRRLVFSPDASKGEQRRPSKRESIPRFLAVAAGILTLSTIGVFLLHTYLAVPESAAKLGMDFALFFLNYRLQRSWVFVSEPTVNLRRHRRGA